MFLASTSATSGRGPTDDFWYMPAPARTAAGVPVSSDSAMRLSTLYACVRNISEDIGKLPFPMYRRGPNDARTRETQHPVAKLLMQPNPSQTGNEWREMGQSHIELRGNFYNEIRYQGSRPSALIPLHPDFVVPELLPDYSLRYKVRDPSGAKPDRILLADEVLHIRSLATNGPVGLNPVEANRETIGEAIATREYSAAFWKNDARPGIWLKHPTAFKDANMRSEFLARFNAQFRGEGRGGVWLSEHDIDLKEIGIKNTDAQYMESRKMQREDIAAIFRMPPHKVGIMDKATFSNIEQQAIEYVVDCLHGRCRRWEERVALTLLTESEREEFYFEFLLAELLRGETKARFEAYGLGINAGWFLRNEARRAENLPPVAGLDRPLLPLNTAQLDAQGNPPPQPAIKPPATTPPTGQASHAARLVRAAAARLVRKEVAALTKIYERYMGNGLTNDGLIAQCSGFFSTHVAHVAESMAIEPADAEKWCARRQTELLAAARLEIETRTPRVPLCLAGWQTIGGEDLAAFTEGLAPPAV